MVKNITRINTIMVVLILATFCKATPILLINTELEKFINEGASYEFLLIDVRDSISTLDGVIATDICKPYNLSWNQRIFDKSIELLPKQTTIIIYCQSGNRSGLAAHRLDSLGFAKVYTLVGGINSWNKPLKPPTYLKLINDLPEPSYKNSTVIQKRQHTARTTVKHYSSFSSNLLGQKLICDKPRYLIDHTKPVLKLSF